MRHTDAERVAHLDVAPANVNLVDVSYPARYLPLLRDGQSCRGRPRSGRTWPTADSVAASSKRRRSRGNRKSRIARGCARCCPSPRPSPRERRGEGETRAAASPSGHLPTSPPHTRSVSFRRLRTYRQMTYRWSSAEFLLKSPHHGPCIRRRRRITPHCQPAGRSLSAFGPRGQVAGTGRRWRKVRAPWKHGGG